MKAPKTRFYPRRKAGLPPGQRSDHAGVWMRTVASLHDRVITKISIVFCPANSLTKSLHLSQNGLSSGSPYKGPLVQVVLLDIVLNAAYQVLDAVE